MAARCANLPKRTFFPVAGGGGDPQVYRPRVADGVQVAGRGRGRGREEVPGWSGAFQACPEAVAEFSGPTPAPEHDRSSPCRVQTASLAVCRALVRAWADASAASPAEVFHELGRVLVGGVEQF